MEGLSEYEDRVGICLDTAHLYGAGYNLGTVEGVEETLNEFEYLVGLKWLRVFHLNDTNMALASRKDRHARIGEGLIGAESFRYLVNNPALTEIPGILETPWDTPEQRAGDLLALKAMRGPK